MLTKAQEIEKFRQFLDSLESGSYLEGLFGGMEPFVERCITEDIAHASFTMEFWKNKEEANKQLYATKSAIATAQSELADLERRCMAARKRLDETRDHMLSLATKLQSWI